MQIAMLVLAVLKVLGVKLPFLKRVSADLHPALNAVKNPPVAAVGDAPADVKAAVLAFLDMIPTDGLTLWAKAGLLFLKKIVPTITDKVWDRIVAEVKSPTPVTVAAGEDEQYADTFADCCEQAAGK